MAASAKNDQSTEQPVTASQKSDLTLTFHGRSPSQADLPTKSDALPDAQLGTTISDRYKILSAIGRGGFATVYRAHDTKLGRDVAVKRLRLDDTTDDSQDRIVRFVREARLIASLNHRNIVHVYDHDEDEQGHYIVMEFIPGLSLAAYCKQEGAIAPSKAVELIKEVCLGLSYAHHKQLIHRDIKPANILLLEQDDQLIPKIVDFGLARIGSYSDLSATGYYMGTPFYMAPEQMGNAKLADHRADIYGVGKTLYEMVSGSIPDNVDPAKIPPPDQLAEIIFRCTKADVEERFFSMDALRQELDKLFSQAAEHYSTISSSLLTNLCLNCNSANKELDNFCKSCGAGLSRPCPDCDHDNSIHADYCGGCGFHVRQTFQLMEIQHQVMNLREKKQWQEVVQACTLEMDDTKTLGPLGQNMLRSLQDTREQAALWQHEAEELSMRIKNAVDAGEVEGLLSTIQRYRQLVPDNPELTELLKKTEHRESLQTNQAEETLVLATRSFEQLDDDRVIELISTITEHLLTSEMRELRQQAEQRSKRVKALGRQIQIAEKEDHHDRLLANVEEYLSYRPGDSSMVHLREQLRQQHRNEKIDRRQTIRRRYQSRKFTTMSLVVSLLIVVAGLAFIIVYRNTLQPPTNGNLPPDQEPPNTSPAAEDQWITDAKANFLSKQPLLNSINMVLVPIAGGTFEMGDDTVESLGPRHQVIISHDFYLASYEVTQEQYQQVMGDNPSRFLSLQAPVENISWQDAQKFCLKLSRRESSAAFHYRLPTEAEWEYACRAGHETSFSFGDDMEALQHYAWYAANAKRQTHQAGAKRPNEWRLFDMHGNVMEWCQDWYQANYYQSSVKTNPSGPKEGKKRVVRGGSWEFPASFCISAQRFQLEPDTRSATVGFRVVLLAN